MELDLKYQPPEGAAGAWAEEDFGASIRDRYPTSCPLQSKQGLIVLAQVGLGKAEVVPNSSLDLLDVVTLGPVLPGLQLCSQAWPLTPFIYPHSSSELIIPNVGFQELE